MPRHALAQSRAKNKTDAQKVPQRGNIVVVDPHPMMAVPRDFARDHTISHLARSIMLDWFAGPDPELTAIAIMIRFSLSSEQAEAVFLEMKGSAYVR